MNKPNKPIIALDCDGVLADWHEHAFYILNKLLDSNYSVNDLKEWDIDELLEGSNTCGMYAWEPWKIVNDYGLILREIKKDVIDEREVLNIQYQGNLLIKVEKFIPKELAFITRNRDKDDLAPFDWPLFTYVVSEMEVITE